MKRLLLISNSFDHKKGYLGHCGEEIVNFLGRVKSVLFIPYAIKDFDKYSSTVEKRLRELKFSVKFIHKEKNPLISVKTAESIFIGGGNTFRLLNELYKNKLIELIRNRVKEGLPYIGTSAGSNVACPTIMTTNDMPIVEPPSLKSLNLVTFQINPHYIDADPKSTHMGETREDRIKEYLEENSKLVVGLREGSWLRIEGNKIMLKGKSGAKIFQKGKKPKEYRTNVSLEI